MDSSSSINDVNNVLLDLEREKKLKDPKYNNKYEVNKADGDGNCMYRAIYIYLNKTKQVLRFIKCFNQRSGLKEDITENHFVKWIREFLSKKVLDNKDDDLTKNTFLYLKQLDKNTLKTQISSTWNLSRLKELDLYSKNNIKEFREIISNYLKEHHITDDFNNDGESATYANEFDISLINIFLSKCKDRMYFDSTTIFNAGLPELEFEFKKDNIYLQRINNNHYNSIIPKYK